MVSMKTWMFGEGSEERLRKGDGGGEVYFSTAFVI